VFTYIDDAQKLLGRLIAWLRRAQAA